MTPRADAGRRHLLRGALGCGVLAAAPMRGLADAAPGTRVALVVANAAYASSPLPNAARDGQAMAGLLAEMGFRVVTLRDGTRQSMQAAIEQAAALLRGQQGVGLLYYAGHAMQIDWRNYLLPVDAAPLSAADIPTQAVDVQAVIGAFRAAGTQINILVLDACRDNPFGGVSGGPGLAPQDAPPGTFLAYATAPGHVAEDGSERDGNGLYTRHLLQELRQPAARIEDIFKRVRLRVRRASQGRQVPWESTSLETDFIFATGQVAAVEGNRDSAFADELAAWNRIKDSRRPDDFFAFLQSNPNGRLTELAQFRLDQLQAAQVQPVTGADGLVHLPSGTLRYRVGDAIERELINHLAGSRRRVWLRVTSADEREVVVNRGQGVVDQMGGLIRDFFGTRSPAMVEVPSELRLGRRWRTAYRNRLPSGVLEDCFYEFRVSGIDTVDVPAGRFRCYRIEGSGESVGVGHSFTLQCLKWVDPATMLAMRQRDSFKDNNSGQITFDVEFLVSAIERAPRA